MKRYRPITYGRAARPVLRRRDDNEERPMFDANRLLNQLTGAQGGDVRVREGQQGNLGSILGQLAGGGHRRRGGLRPRRAARRSDRRHDGRRFRRHGRACRGRQQRRRVLARRFDGWWSARCRRWLTLRLRHLGGRQPRRHPRCHTTREAASATCCPARSGRADCSPAVWARARWRPASSACS